MKDAEVNESVEAKPFRVGGKEFDISNYGK